MANVMSMLEKLKLVEKIEKNEENTSETPIEKTVENNKYVENESSKNTGVTGSFEEPVDFGGYKPPLKPEETPIMSTNTNTSIKENANTNVNTNVNMNTKFEAEKVMAVSEIYELNNIEKGNHNTVFLLESFINALPQNLPYDIKKTSVINIVNASYSNLNTLLSEGESRLKVLNKFMNEFQQSLDESMVECKTEILKLTKMIDKYKTIIDEKEGMLEEQRNIVKFESQKINNIIDFFNDDNKF